MGNKVVLGVSIGLAVGVLIALVVFFITRFYRKRSIAQHRSGGLSDDLPVHRNDINSNLDSSISYSISEPPVAKKNAYWGKKQDRDMLTSVSGIPRYSYKDIQKATQNFTTILGQGSFGPVYKAIMPTSEVVAVKVLANDSKQGEKEFQNEVLLLSRLHHRNLVNLVGYSVDKNQRMLVYEFMSNGNLASHLYDNGSRALSWEERLQIALDVSHGIEYLHEGAVPPVIHRDLKSANILLDKSMRAKVADFGLSKEEVLDGRKSGLKGTYGYMDPEYMSTNKFTKKSDVYSFGVILFELITAINPQQGLMEYINLAAMSADGKVDWEEIIDKKLAGKSNLEEVRLLADIAHKCLHKIPRKRPSIADVNQAISRIRQRHMTRHRKMSSSGSDISGILRRIENQQIELTNMTSIKTYPNPA